MSEQKINPVELYASFIAEQSKKGLISESAEVKAAKAYASHEKLSKKGYSGLPLSHGDGFYHKNSEGPDQTYIIKHASGKHSLTDIDHMSDEHQDKAGYEKQSRKQNPHLSDAEHKEVANLIHKNYND